MATISKRALKSDQILGTPTPEFLQAVAIATAAAVAAAAVDSDNEREQVVIATQKAADRITRIAFTLANALNAGDHIAEANAAAAAEGKAAYGKISAAVNEVLKPLVMDDAQAVIAAYLNGMSGEISKHAMTSRKKCIMASFAKLFEGYVIEFEYSRLDAGYMVRVSEAPSDESKATKVFCQSLDKLLEAIKADKANQPGRAAEKIQAILDSYFIG